jgi:nucleotide-binding universal stress UspA family protein
MQNRKILVAVNGSKDVLTQGLRLLKGEECEVTVVKVYPHYEGDLSLVGVKDIQNVLDGGVEKDLSEIHKVADNEGASVKVKLVDGDIREKIIEVAEEEKCDLIIMGANSQNSIKKLFLGNLLDEVSRQAPCPVLVVNDKKVSDFSYLYRFCEHTI